MHRAYCCGSILAVATTAILTGCGFHLHNVADESLARKASDAFQAADVAKLVTDERAVLKAANDRDLAATRRSIIAQRDALIIAAIGENQTADTMLAEISRRRATLGFPTALAEAKKLHDLPQLLRDAMTRRDAYLVAILQPGSTVKPPAFPPTDDDRDAADAAGGAIKTLFHLYKDASDKYMDALAALTSADNGEIGALNSRLTIAQQISTKLESEVHDAKDALAKAITEYKTTAALKGKGHTDTKTAVNKISSALNKLDAIVPKLEDTAKKAGVEDLLAQVRLERLKAAQAEVGTFFEAVSNEQAGESNSNKHPPADAAGRTAAIVLGTSEKFRDASVDAKLVPLLFEQERLRIETERLQRQVDRGKRRITLLEQEREAAVAEGMKLLAASNMLNHAAGKSKPTMQALLNGANKGETLQALFLLAESVGIYRLKREEAEVDLIALDHDEALDASEFALALWKQTIGAPLEQLVAYHAGGLTPEEVAQLLQAAGVAGVAVGVNR